jgi:hypothetical protein
MGKYKRNKKRAGTARDAGGLGEETGSSAQSAEIIGRWEGNEGVERGWTGEDLKGRVRDNPKAQALLSGNYLAKEVVKESDRWPADVVYLHWTTCRMCGKLHHSLMMHILDDDDKVVGISPTEYERMRFE